MQRSHSNIFCFIGFLCLLFFSTILSHPAVLRAETPIPYKEGPGGGQIINLDDFDTTKKETVDQPLGGAPEGNLRGTVQAPIGPAAPPRSIEDFYRRNRKSPNWEEVPRAMGDADGPKLQPLQPFDRERLHQEYLAKHPEIEEKRKQIKKQNVQEKVQKNLADNRTGRKAGKPRIPSANELDLMMEKLLDPRVSTADKQRITAVLFVHQDIYRNAVLNNSVHTPTFSGDSAKVKEFLKWKESLQEDVIRRLGAKYKAQYGTALKAPVIPFSYNNIHSDDDIITGSGHRGKIMEKLYAESLDEVIRERAGRAMTEADRLRVDVNGLAWDMTQKGAFDNFRHKEKYISPQAGFANQEKLLSAGDKVKVLTFDDNGKMIRLSGPEATAAIKQLAVDVPIKIPGIDLQSGSGSMSEYIRMADMHKVKFKEGIVTAEEVGAFIRNQKYTERLEADFAKNGSGTHPEMVSENKKFMELSLDIRKQMTIEGVARTLNNQYGLRTIDVNGFVDFEALTKAIRLHQEKQLVQVLPQMLGAVSTNEAYKMVKWLKTASTSDRLLLRKQMALTYAPLTDQQKTRVLSDLDGMKISDADRVFLKSIVENDTKQIVRYARLMDQQVRGMTVQMNITGDNYKLAKVFSEEARFTDLNNSFNKYKGGSKFKEFLESKTARALNLDLMLGLESTTPRDKLLEGGGKLMQVSLILLAAQRAYAAGKDETDSIKQVGLAMFNMIPFVAGALRTSEGEYREAAKEFMMDALPPLALANLAAMGLNYAGESAKNSFTESKLEQIARDQLAQMDDSYFVESADLPGFYRIKNRKELTEYMDEVSSALGRLAKFPALISQHIDARMQQNKQVQLNNQALVTCLWFEGFEPRRIGGIGVIDYVMKNLIAPEINAIFANYRISDLQSRVYENGVPAIEEAPPVERVAAKIILENMSIRAQLYEAELNAFIDRIERLYNEQKAKSPGQSEIVRQTIKALRELYTHAPSRVVESPTGQPLLEEEFLKQEDFLSNYKPTDIADSELQQEMQQLLDDFRLFIDKLALGVDFFLEQRYLDLKAEYYGGDSSMEPLSASYVLAGDEFRIGLSARVNDRRKQAKWTAYYYIFDGKRWAVLGHKTMDPGRYRPGNHGPDVLWEIVAPEKDSFIAIQRTQIEKYFNKAPAIYEVYPVLAFGDWKNDPLTDVGISALENPIEYAQQFSEGTMAFIGEPLEIKMAEPRFYVQTGDAAYRNTPLQVALSFAVPEYAGDRLELSAMHIVSPEQISVQPSMTPTTVASLSADSDHPTIVSLTFPPDAKEGQYILTATARVRGMPDAYQPEPVSVFFDYLNAEAPKEKKDSPAGDLADLLQKMRTLRKQAGEMRSQTSTLVEEIGSMSSSAAEQCKAAGQQLDALEAVRREHSDSSTSGGSLAENVPNPEKSALSVAEIRTTIENEALQLCQSYEQIKQADSAGQRTRILERVESTAESIQNHYGNFSRARNELEQMREQLNRAKDQFQQAGRHKNDDEALQKAGEMVEQCNEQCRKIMEHLNKNGKIDKEIDSMTAVLYAITDKANATHPEDVSDEEYAIFQSLYDLKAEIQDDFAQILAVRSSRKTDISCDETRTVSLTGRLSALSGNAPQGPLTMGGKIMQEVENFLAEIDAAEIFFEPIEEAHKSAKICRQGAVDMHVRNSKTEESMEKASCRDYPGTVKKWDATAQEVQCVCPDENTRFNNQLGRCAIREEFETAKADCADFPGTEARWHPETNDVRCDCAEAGKKFNTDLGRCVTREEFEVTRTDCSKWKDSTAVWDESSQRASCDCLGDYQWNKANTSCIKKPHLQLAETDTKCAKWPKSQAVWDAANEQAVCDCVGDYEWNSPQDNACRIKKEIQLAEVRCPSGTSAKWNSAQEKAQCSCDQGTWDSMLGRCITARERALAEKVCPPCEEPYYDEAAGTARCRCARGCDTDTRISDRCLPKEELARLQRQRQTEEEARNRRVEEERRQSEARKLAERRKYCLEALAKLNSAVRSGAQAWEISMLQSDSMNWDCPSDEYEAASKGQWGAGGGRSDPGKPNWSNGCWPKNNTGGAKLEWLVTDPPPYSGTSPLCSDRDGVSWFLGKRVTSVKKGRKTSSGCFSGSTVISTRREYPNVYICPAPGGGAMPRGNSSGKFGGGSGMDTGLPPSHPFGAPW